FDRPPPCTRPKRRLARMTPLALRRLSAAEPVPDQLPIGLASQRSRAQRRGAKRSGDAYSGVFAPVGGGLSAISQTLVATSRKRFTGSGGSPASHGCRPYIETFDLSKVAAPRVPCRRL